jgi:phosphoribosylformylglycinamidine synthase
MEFRCQVERLKVEDSLDYFNKDNMGETLRLPIAHGEGNYYIDPDGLQELEANQQILLRYENNPNGSVADIAAIRNKAGNVFGMMPHPERAVEQDIHPTTDGVAVLKAFLYQIRRLKAEDSEAASA